MSSSLLSSSAGHRLFYFFNVLLNPLCKNMYPLHLMTHHTQGLFRYKESDLKSMYTHTHTYTYTYIRISNFRYFEILTVEDCRILKMLSLLKNNLKVL